MVVVVAVLLVVLLVAVALAVLVVAASRVASMTLLFPAIAGLQPQRYC